jgi:two-component system sensor histidine kinase NblS
VRNIIERHRSKVHLISEVGVGTTFWFDLTLFEEETPKKEIEPTNVSY